jgi:hypothetical protein
MHRIYCSAYGCIVVGCCFQSFMLCKKKKKKIRGTLEDLRFFLKRNGVVEGSDILMWFRLFRCYAGGVLAFSLQWAYDLFIQWAICPFCVV